MIHKNQINQKAHNTIAEKTKSHEYILSFLNLKVFNKICQFVKSTKYCFLSRCLQSKIKIHSLLKGFNTLKTLKFSVFSSCFLFGKKLSLNKKTYPSLKEKNEIKNRRKVNIRGESNQDKNSLPPPSLKITIIMKIILFSNTNRVLLHNQRQDQTNTGS